MGKFYEMWNLFYLKKRNSKCFQTVQHRDEGKELQFFFLLSRGKITCNIFWESLPPGKRVHTRPWCWAALSSDLKVSPSILHPPPIPRPYTHTHTHTHTHTLELLTKLLLRTAFRGKPHADDATCQKTRPHSQLKGQGDSPSAGRRGGLQASRRRETSPLFCPRLAPATHLLNRAPPSKKKEPSRLLNEVS